MQSSGALSRHVNWPVAKLAAAARSMSLGTVIWSSGTAATRGRRRRHGRRGASGGRRGRRRAPGATTVVVVGGTVVGATTLVGTATGVTVGPEASTTGGRSLWRIGGTINVAASTLADSPIITASHGRCPQAP